MIKLKTPLNLKDLAKLKPGDEVLLSGTVYAMRDAAHALYLKEPAPPLNLKEQVIYYMGPTPARPGRPIGSCGPTTSARMDKYTPNFVEKTGIISIIGKGARSTRVRSALKGKAVYFVTYGGLGALLAKCIKSSEMVLYPHLGAEAVYRLEIKDMPLITAFDFKGNGEIK